MATIPPQFGEEFLEWLRIETERAWASLRPRTFEQYVAAGVGGLSWAPGTRWGRGLTEDEIAAIERRRGLRFPPDYRLFLRVLHAPDRPQTGALFEGARLVPAEGPSFYNWLTDADAIDGALEWPFEGLCFDVEYNHLWLESWGPRPASVREQIDVLRAQVRAAPRLIPICGHRYLVGEPCVSGNPVLSVYQSDIIVYGDDLRGFLLGELHPLLGRAVEDCQVAPVHDAEADSSQVTPGPRIPFWDAFIE